MDSERIYYILFIDGRFFGFYDSLERAQEDAFCGDNFRIFEAKQVWEKINESSEEE